MLRRTGLALLVLLSLIGCTSWLAGRPVGNHSTADRALVTGYFDALNAAAQRGSAGQERLFARTQHPDFRAGQCSLRGLTLTTDPAYSTLRPDPRWRPDRTTDRPRGTVYVVAATITVAHNSEVLGNQIGSLHVVVLNGTAYGFTPCPT